jgi:hypothetical protein
VIRRHRAGIGSRWRRPTAGRQALLVLVHLRCGDPYSHLAVSFGVGATTAYRHVIETVDLLAATTTSLEGVLAGRAGCEATILHGTIITSYRVRWTCHHKQWSCARKKTYGVNLQALTDEHGNLLWISTELLGGVHDLTAPRQHAVVTTAARHAARP